MPRIVDGLSLGMMLVAKAFDEENDPLRRRGVRKQASTGNCQGLALNGDGA